MSPAFIFTAALLCGIIIGLVAPMVVAFISTLRVAVYRKAPARSDALLVTDVDVEELDLSPYSEWGIIRGPQPEDSEPVELDLPEWLKDSPAPVQDW